MRVLLLGKGYVSSYLSKQLIADGFDVTVLSKSELNYTNTRRFRYYLQHVNHANVVVNCSGYTGTPNIDSAEHEKELCWNLNVTSPVNIHNICVEQGVKYVHISSGCIFDGYDKIYTELDTPNFGLFDAKSSFYSKSKHAYELITKDLPGVTFRIRMPFGPDKSPRNYLTKIHHYSSLINNINSRTYMPDFVKAVSSIIAQHRDTELLGNNIYHVVNSNPLAVSAITTLMNSYGYGNNDWIFKDITELNIKANRSNCIISNEKIISHNVPIRSDEECLREALSAIQTV